MPKITCSIPWDHTTGFAGACVGSAAIAVSTTALVALAELFFPAEPRADTAIAATKTTAAATAMITNRFRSSS